MTTASPPCVHYSLTQSTGSAVCRLHHNQAPTQCLCPDYSPDYGVTGPRLTRWTYHLMYLNPDIALSPTDPTP